MSGSLIVPTFKVDWTRSHGYAENKTSRKYKVRELDNLPPHATKHFAKIVTSTTVSQVTESLASLNIYDPSTGITSWKAAAKLFDDWRLVVSGPHTADLWALHNVEELGSNQHSMWLCYGCPIASKWGPCEHMYCALEHEGCTNAVDLPKPKPKGRPKTSALKPTAKVPGALLVPGCGLASNSGAASSTSAPPNVHQMSEADVALQNCLRAAGLGQYFRHMQQECVTLGALQGLYLPRLQSLLWHDDWRSSQTHAAVTASCQGLSPVCRPLARQGSLQCCRCVRVCRV